MFGRNKRLPFEKGTTGKDLLVREVFSTLQGEGPFAGMPAVFVRLGGCHLACQFCDTDFDAENSSRVDVRELVDGIHARFERTPPTLFQTPARARLVVLTGGEPMRQNITPLVETLCDEGFHVQIETAGSFWPFPDTLPFSITGNPYRRGCSIVVSPKTTMVCDAVAANACAWKYVVRARDVEDLENSLDGKVVRSVRLTDPQDASRKIDVPWPQQEPEYGVFLQPCDEGSKQDRQELLEQLAELCQRRLLRLSIQTHKLARIP
jgi:7-carboxy-7-deazaguanine synthase